MTVFKAPIRRRNYGRGHGYRDAENRKVPGVTTLTGNGFPKPALVPWAAETTAGYAIDHWDELAALPPSERMKRMKKAPTEARNSAALRGTKLHALATGLIAGDEVPVPDESASLVETYLRFLDEWDPAPVAVEAPVVSYRHGYAGTLDLIADVPVYGRGLMDIKTSRSGVYGDVALQLAGYRYADTYQDNDGTEHGMPAVDFTAVVWVREDGYDVIPVDAGPEQHRAFLYVAQVAAFAEGARDLVGDPMTMPRREVAA